jgi:hypothetical protein
LFDTMAIIGRVCVDARCPVDWTPKLGLLPNDIIEIEVNTQTLTAKFYVPRIGFQF